MRESAAGHGLKTIAISVVLGLLDLIVGNVARTATLHLPGAKDQKSVRRDSCSQDLELLRRNDIPVH